MQVIEYVLKEQNSLAVWFLTTNVYLQKCIQSKQCLHSNSMANYGDAIAIE